ncbi:hypothetical protein [Carboxylicivirga marina]|uniref:Lipocalin-like domain-containing protein n=1 Tax=Carboxylicivirga marina TaxID=2800988 RepID=A0ABS1HI21_9BACT|nr:hypothetical protein [Carboxylicivirga marina]MBK3517302.1 hypothetical protein [Carboxylicivirga marina]
MKNLLKFTLGLLVCATLFSCDKDDDDNSPAGNTIEMNGESFKIDMNVFSYNSFGDVETSSINLVNLDSSSTLAIMLVNTTGESVDGTYVFPGELTDLRRLDGTNYMANSSMTSIKEGTVSVSKDGDIYTLVIDITMEDDTTFKGEYTEELVAM